MAKLKSKDYPHAPITEAVIEIRLSANVNEQLQKKVVQRLKKTYPNVSPMQSIGLRIDTTGGEVGVEQQNQGFRLTTDEQADVVLVMPHGVSIARLAPYPGWPSLRDRAKTVWKHWRAAAPRQTVSRLGVRYINRIDIPTGKKSKIRLQDFLRIHPQVPTFGSAPMLGYMMQVTVPTDDPMWATTITSTIVTPPPLLNFTSLLLDIDVFRTDAIPQRERELWATIEGARGIKNDVFENCITDKARSLFS